MAVTSLFCCVVIAITLFLPLQNAQFGFAPFEGFSQFQQIAKGRGPNQDFGRGPQNNRNPQRQQSSGSVPWLEAGNSQQRPSGGQVPWTESQTGNQQQQGQVPWTETQTGNRQEQGQGQVPWSEVPQGGQQGGNQVPWWEIRNPTQQGGVGQGGAGQSGAGQSGTGTTTTTERPSRPCSCTSTAEYNPVCGSDNATYSNPGRLQCAIQCRQRNGQNAITLVHYGVCRVEQDTRG